MEERQRPGNKENAHHRQDGARHERQRRRGVHHPGEGLTVPSAVLLGDDHCGAGGDAHEEAQNQVDDRGRGSAHGAQGVHANEIAHHQGVHGVVHLLEEGAQGHRQEEEQDLLPDDAGEKGVFLGALRFHRAIPFP